MHRHPAPVELPAGACLTEHLAAGATVWVRGGSVRVHEPLRCLAGQWLQPTQLLHEGQQHRLDDGGWIRVDALHGGASVQLLPATPWLVQWWRAWVGARAARPVRPRSAAVDAA